jgi:hypothetical protein
VKKFNIDIYRYRMKSTYTYIIVAVGIIVFLIIMYFWYFNRNIYERFDPKTEKKEISILYDPTDTSDEKVNTLVKNLEKELSDYITSGIISKIVPDKCAVREGGGWSNSCYTTVIEGNKAGRKYYKMKVSMLTRMANGGSIVRNQLPKI